MQTGRRSGILAENGLRHEMEENGRLVRFIFHKGETVAEQAGLTQAEFNDLCNNPDLYFMQNKRLNGSHLGEDKPGLAQEQREKNLERYRELARQIIEEKLNQQNQSP